MAFCTIVDPLETKITKSHISQNSLTNIRKLSDKNKFLSLFNCLTSCLTSNKV